MPRSRSRAGQRRVRLRADRRRRGCKDLRRDQGRAHGRHQCPGAVRRLLILQGAGVYCRALHTAARAHGLRKCILHMSWKAVVRVNEQAAMDGTITARLGRLSADAPVGLASAGRHLRKKFDFVLMDAGRTAVTRAVARRLHSPAPDWRISPSAGDDRTVKLTFVERRAFPAPGRAYFSPKLSTSRRCCSPGPCTHASLATRRAAGLRCRSCEHWRAAALWLPGRQ